MVNKLELLATENFWLVLVIPVLAYILMLTLQKRRLVLEKLAVNALSQKINLKLVLPHLLIIACMVFSLLRPSIGYEEIKIKQNSYDLLFLVDISKSMLADDVKPSRLNVAKHKILDSLKILENNNIYSRVGLILFAGTAYTFCPLTEDLNAFKVFVNAINPELIRQPGSNLENALESALRILQASQAMQTTILILSDFEQQKNNDQNLVDKLSNFNLSINGIGLGTTVGSAVKLPDGKFLRDQKGEFVISRLDQKRLKFLASNLNGQFVEAKLTNEDLHSILNLNRDSQITKERELRNHFEIGAWLCLFALLVLIIFWFKGAPGIIFVFILILANYNNKLNAESSEDSTSQNHPSSFTNIERQAYLAYTNKDFELASKLYEQALTENPNDAKLKFGLASSLHQLKKYELAGKSFEELANSSTDGRSAFQALYNSGTSALFGKNYDSAIKQLEKALEIKPKDEFAEKNLEIAKKLKEQQQKQEEQQEEQEKQEQQNEQNQNKEDKEQEQQSSDAEQQENQEPKQSDNSSTSKQEPNNPEKSKEQEAKKQDGKSEENKKNDASSNKNEKEQENNKELKNNSNSNKNKGEQKFSEAELTQDQAKAWLESLPSAPVILREHGGRSEISEDDQTW